MNQGRTRRTTGMTALVLALILVASACGSDGDTQTDDGQDQATDQDAGTGEDSSGDEPVADESGGNAVAASIAWTAPDGMDASTIAVSPGGDQVAIAFSSMEPGAEIVVFDVASGAEAWRGSIEDAGAFGLGGLMFTTEGVSFHSTTFDGSQIVTFTDGNSSTTAAVPTECAQFLSGTVDPTQNVAYTVVPGGFCRVDLSTGATLEVAAGDLLEGALGANGSIRYVADGTLVATMMGPDGAPVAVSVDPTTLTAIAPVAEVPVRLENLYGDLLVAGPSLAAGDRIASTPDGSTVVLLQPTTIEVLG